MIQTQEVPLLGTNVAIDIAIIADQVAFFTDDATPHTPTKTVDSGKGMATRSLVVTHANGSVSPTSHSPTNLVNSFRVASLAEDMVASCRTHRRCASELRACRTRGCWGTG